MSAHNIAIGMAVVGGLAQLYLMRDEAKNDPTATTLAIAGIVGMLMLAMEKSR